MGRLAQSELFELGAHDRRLAALALEIEGAFEAAEMAGSERAVAQLQSRCEELGEGPLPQRSSTATCIRGT